MSAAASPAGAPRVILVDAADRPIGEAEKLAAHQPPGQLHRAISAFVLDDEDRLLLQRRADVKHAFAGAWSNSCCTHPEPGESVEAAAERRAAEELGLRLRFESVGVFTYRATDPASGLVEHEVDHVLVGRSSATPEPNPDEVAAVMVVTLAELQEQLEEQPERFTPWLAPALEVLLDGARSAPIALRPSQPKDRTR
jgi:isopentenyl-diphosphate delta-isomerase